MERITLIVPALNEKDNIFPFFDRCAEVEKENNTAFRYIFIDDGSTDGTCEEIKRLKALHPDSGSTGLNMDFEKEPIADYVFRDAAKLAKALEEPYDMEKLRAFRNRYIDTDTENCTSDLADFIESLI